MCILHIITYRESPAMKAAIVSGAGQAPIYGDFPSPEAQAGEERVTIIAAALSPVVRGRAAGKHYSAPGAYPFIAGVDGVGRPDSGRREIGAGTWRAREWP